MRVNFCFHAKPIYHWIYKTVSVSSTMLLSKKKEVHLKTYAVTKSWGAQPRGATPNELSSHLPAIMWEHFACEKWSRMKYRVDAISHNWHQFYIRPHPQRTRSVLLTLTLTNVYYTVSGALLMNITHLSVLKAFSLCIIARKLLHSCHTSVGEWDGGCGCEECNR